MAIAVTTKIEKRATVRNKIKRRLRELFRVFRHDLTEPLDMVVVARREVQECSFDDYKREVLGALRSKGYFKKANRSPM